MVLSSFPYKSAVTFTEAVFLYEKSHFLDSVQSFNQSLRPMSASGIFLLPESLAAHGFAAGILISVYAVGFSYSKIRARDDFVSASA